MSGPLGWWTSIGRRGQAGKWRWGRASEARGRSISSKPQASFLRGFYGAPPAPCARPSLEIASDARRSSSPQKSRAAAFPAPFDPRCPAARVPPFTTLPGFSYVAISRNPTTTMTDGRRPEAASTTASRIGNRRSLGDALSSALGRGTIDGAASKRLREPALLLCPARTAVSELLWPEATEIGEQRECAMTVTLRRRFAQASKAARQADAGGRSTDFGVPLQSPRRRPGSQHTRTHGKHRPIRFHPPTKLSSGQASKQQALRRGQQASGSADDGGGDDDDDNHQREHAASCCQAGSAPEPSDRLHSRPNIGCGRALRPDDDDDDDGQVKPRSTVSQRLPLAVTITIIIVHHHQQCTGSSSSSIVILPGQARPR
ncbi:uncharacterized protein PSFLO_02436 [Pseudozyma flocculosa]|uniref:Uncharacterized protein n=1 Tax=Pseudozyma flocculosa TaxID=84751 RepID=A0A5C3EXK6_9BASI|nr:uncharacterized protein PSFLO_02436 [Pseudozyma flocculosa]